MAINNFLAWYNRLLMRKPVNVAFSVLTVSLLCTVLTIRFGRMPDFSQPTLVIVCAFRTIALIMRIHPTRAHRRASRPPARTSPSGFTLGTSSPTRTARTFKTRTMRAKMTPLGTCCSAPTKCSRLARNPPAWADCFYTITLPKTTSAKTLKMTSFRRSGRTSWRRPRCRQTNRRLRSAMSRQC